MSLKYEMYYIIDSMTQNIYYFIKHSYLIYIIRYLYLLIKKKYVNINTYMSYLINN